MKKSKTIFLLAMLTASLACQTLFSKPALPRDGTVISGCTEIIKAMHAMQSNDVPKKLYETGIKQGDEFDVNEYFTVLPNLSMQDGYTLDYVFQGDSLGSFPTLAARPTDLPPYETQKDIPNPDLNSYWNYIEVQDNEQGYFEYVTLTSLAGQFYLVWHANYYDLDIVCNQNAVDDIVADRNTNNFGLPFDNEQMKQIRALQNIEPLVKLTDTTAIVEVITFSKWGGFFRKTYTIDRAFPHEIINTQEENLVPYDCGIMF